MSFIIYTERPRNKIEYRYSRVKLCKDSAYYDTLMTSEFAITYQACICLKFDFKMNYYIDRRCNLCLGKGIFPIPPKELL